MAEKKRKVLQPQTKFKQGEEPVREVFVVRQGQTFGLKRLRAGTEVELTVEEAIPFSDKLEPKDRNSVLPGDASPEELAELGIVQVANPTAATTDRNVMTPQQRAETSQTPVGGDGPDASEGSDVGAGGRRASGTSKKG
jgi:hypothetical protein